MAQEHRSQVSVSPQHIALIEVDDMIRRKRLTKTATAVAMSLIAQVSFAGVAGCVPGWQDNTCVTAIVHGYIQPPTCSSAPGWTTAAAAQWIGSQWTQPQCNFVQQPSCPAGQTQVQPASWNGAQWVGLSCAPPAPPSAPIGGIQALENDCKNRTAATGLQFEDNTQIQSEVVPQVDETNITITPMLGPESEEGVSQSNQWSSVCQYRTGSTTPFNTFVVPLPIDTPGGEGG
jgi:hypothetical protein